MTPMLKTGVLIQVGASEADSRVFIEGPASPLMVSLLSDARERVLAMLTAQPSPPRTDTTGMDFGQRNRAHSAQR